MSPLRLALVLLSVASGVVGQNVTDVPVPPGTPRFLSLVFTDGDAICALTSGPSSNLYCWTGLPDSPNLTVTTLAGANSPAGPWYRLDDRTAAFNTAGGMVSLVRGLPDQPITVSTSLAAGTPLRWVNPYTAIRIQPSGFEVVRHDDLGSTVTFIPTPGLVVATEFGFGGIDGGSAVALGVGADGTGGTIDDVIIRVDGLDGVLPSSAVVTSVTRTAGWAPDGFLVTPSGAAVVWSSPALSTFDVEVRSFVGPGSSTPLSITVPAPSGHFFNGSWSFGARTLPPDGLLFEYDDDLGTGRAWVREVNGAPSVVDVWYFSTQFYFGEEILDDRTSVSYDFVSYYGFNQTRWVNGGSSVSSFVPDVCWTTLGFAAPHGGVVAAFANGSICSGPGVLGGVLVLDHLTPAGQSTQMMEFPGQRWALSALPAGVPHGFSMGPGRVAGFVATQAPYLSPNILRIATFPVAATGEAPGKRLGPTPVATNLSPSVPSIATPLTLTVTAPAGSAPIAQLGLSLTPSRPVYLNPFDAVLHLDIGQILPLIPVPLNGPPGGPMVGTFTIPGGLPPSLIGMVHYAQVAVDQAGVLALSDLMVVSYGL